jgi:DNA-binding MarR family transcriptional regulator
LDQAICDKPGVSLARSPLHLLHRVGQVADNLLHAELSDLDITPRQFAILAALSAHEGASQTALTELTGIDRSTIADVIPRMLQKGLLHRTRTKDDARIYAVTLSERGEQTFNEAKTAAERAERKLLAALPAGHADRFVDSLHIIVGIHGDS